MKSSIILRGATLTLGVVFAALAAPAAADDIPAYETLSCEKDCPPHTDAKALVRPIPNYPSRYTGMMMTFVEALVDIDFTVATDGTIKDPKVEYLLGPHQFADNALAAVAARRYEPPTEDGKPVEESHRVRFMFRLRDAPKVGREEVARTYARAMTLARSDKLAEAVAVLKEAAQRPEMNFYERTMVAYALATILAHTSDTVGARDAARIATIDDGKLLDKHARANALRLRIALEAQCGDFAESFAWFEILKQVETIKDGDPTALLVAKLHAMIADPAPLAMPAVIPPAGGEPTFWQHTLLRRSFEFHNVEGKLDNFNLFCNRHGIRSVISEKANWTVPATWSGCVLNVFGAPGAKFQLLEFPPPVDALK